MPAHDMTTASITCEGCKHAYAENALFCPNCGRNFGETADGAQRPLLSVFNRTGGEIRHFWSSELLYAPTEPGQDPRHVGTLEPLWNLFDMTRQGRPVGWDEQLSYPE